MAKKKIEDPGRATPRRRSTVPATSRKGLWDRTSTRSDPTHAEIAEAAYHRYLRRGGQGGSDIDDWVEAERDLRERIGR